MTPILYKHEKTKRYCVNFHPYISEVIREAEYMYKLDLGNLKKNQELLLLSVLNI